MNVFIDNRKDGLVLKFEGGNHWNFYDWSPYLDGELHGMEDAIPDLMINLLFILALQNLREIAFKIGKSFAYEDLLKESKKRANEAFYNAGVGLYSMTMGGNEYTVLGNALAILAGLELDKEYVCEKIVNGELSDCSLSMKIFKYDALLATDKEKYQEWVLNEIRRAIQSGKRKMGRAHSIMRAAFVTVGVLFLFLICLCWNRQIEGGNE